MSFGSNLSQNNENKPEMPDCIVAVMDGKSCRRCKTGFNSGLTSLRRLLQTSDDGNKEEKSRHDTMTLFSGVECVPTPLQV